MAPADLISFEAPLDGDFRPVVRLIVGGIAERADFGFESMDDLQLAIERLLVEAGSDGQVELSFELRQGGIRTRIGPLHERGLAESLQDSGESAASLSLGRILRTVVDSYGVEEVSGGDIVVRLEKLGGRPRGER
jgi:hypothetical protein